MTSPQLPDLMRLADAWVVAAIHKAFSGATGNNIGLRIRMMHCENAKSIRLRGEQHLTFEDTLP